MQLRSFPINLNNKNLDILMNILQISWIFTAVNSLPIVPFFTFSMFFLNRPRRFSSFAASMDAARLRTDFPANMQKKVIFN